MSKLIYDATIEIIIKVSFSDLTRAREYFVECESWTDTFVQIDDIEELVEILADYFYHSTNRWDRELQKTIKFIEGFGRFIQINEFIYESVDLEEYCGKITIEIGREPTRVSAYTIST